MIARRVATGENAVSATRRRSGGGFRYHYPQTVQTPALSLDTIPDGGGRARISRAPAPSKNKESKNQALQRRFTFAFISTIFIMIVSLTFLFYVEPPSTTPEAESNVEEELYEEYGLTSFTFYQNDNSDEQ